MITSGLNIDFEICKYYAPTEYNLDALYNGYFWFSKRERLNDPFDLAGFRNYRTQWLANSGLLAPSFLAKIVDENGKIDFYKEYASCSFTRSPLNRLMWAYYTNNYQGWCLVFRTRNILKQPNEQLKEVIYVNDKFKPIDPNVTLDYEKEPEILLRVKHEDWAHESEERIIIKRNNNDFKRAWASNILASIIVGHNMNEAFKSILTSYGKEKHIPVYITEQGIDFNLEAKPL